MNTEDTRTTGVEVESCLRELHKLDPSSYWRIVITGYTTPGGVIKQDVDIVATALVTLEQRIMRASTLAEAMAQVRAWKEQEKSNV